ncbi:VWA domain-containing protein [Paracrocinitomix mangrovi]|uniref:vWA domain-containing protein n=1 Tax=Paracrocinitomix mangrovi TaxID=2862509 RepID=UPI001C8E18B3|nr:VWA domain-containing protein [Paracrocinitomix mangrovi]UKN01312.1 VWA domain-containing protein [Paracrocinitomix mangrovi]
MDNNLHKYNIKHILIAVVIWEVIFWALLGSFYYYIADKEVLRFENQFFLWGLVIIPLLVMGYFVVLQWKNKTLSQLAPNKLLRYLTTPVSEVKSFFKFFLLRNGLALLIIALANPQYGKSKNKMVAEGIEILIALDISNSMHAMDLDPSRDRLTVAKMSIDRLLHNLHGDKIGILVFAGDAFLQVPLTQDYRAVRMFLQSITPEMMTNQGTSISLAIDKCIENFDMENGVNKAIIVMSDGEDHEGEAEEKAAAAKELGIIVSTVGMGTTNETPIPEYKNGKVIGLKKDYAGNTVFTKLNEDMLRGIANAGGGRYTKAEGNFVNMEELLETIKRLEKTEMESDLYSDFEDQYHWFLALGLILLIGEFFITESRSGVVHKLQDYEI